MLLVMLRLILRSKQNWLPLYQMMNYPVSL